MTNCEKIFVEKSQSLLCLDFDIPLKHLIMKHADGMHFLKLDTVQLWFYVKNQLNPHRKLRMEILNLNSSAPAIAFNDEIESNDWNAINIKDIFQFPHLSFDSLSKSMKLTLIIKCLFECSIGHSASEQTFFDEPNNANDIWISNSVSKKPLLSFNLLDESERSTSSASREKRNDRLKETKAVNYGMEDYSHNICKNNYPDAYKECCLVTYFVNFNALKWSWILSPRGFLANYCAGKCSEKKSKQLKAHLFVNLVKYLKLTTKQKKGFKYASHNTEVKLKYNERIMSGDNFNPSELLETCCHPVSMDSLLVKYVANNGSVVSTVIPNMIITGCGCS